MKKQLREYQIEIKDRVYKEYSKGKRSILLVLPTGCGKTVTFVSMVEEISRNEQFGENHSSAIMVHRKELLAQISLTLAGEGIVHNIIAPAATIRNIIALQRQQYGKQFYNHNSNVTILSVDTLNSRISRYGDWAKGIKFIVVDEAAHVLKANKWGRAVDLFPQARILGVTATPQRLDKKGLGIETDGVFEKIIVGVTPRWAIDNGYLSKYKIVAPKSDYEQYLGHNKSTTSDYSKEQMSDASEKSQIVGDVVQNYQKFAAGKQSIVFASDIASARRMEKEFLDVGIPAKLLTGESSDKERFDGVQAFKDNKINVLLNVDLFDEGFDIAVSKDKKIVEIVSLARPTMSLGKYLQTIGRALRPAPNKEYALIIDHVGNIKRHGLPCTERKWSLDRPEKRRNLESLVRICNGCAAAYERSLTECPFCGLEATSKTRDGGGRTPPDQVDGDLFLIDPDTLRELEHATILETPESIGQRVGAAAGLIAGKSAAKKQRERIEVQQKLAEVVANWAGQMKSKGMTDRQIHKEYYIKFGKTISQSLAEPRLQMTEMIEELSDYATI
jgi:superfamily II DNA or RNA helicase